MANTKVASRNLKVNKIWFTGLLSDKRISQRKFAAALGTDPSAMSRMLDGDQSWRPQHIEAAANVLGVPIGDVMAHLGVDASAGTLAEVPVIGWVGPSGHVTLGRPQGLPAKVEAPSGLPRDAVVVIYRTAGTASGFRDGWTMFYVPRPDIHPDALGRLCVIETADHKISIRVLNRGYGPGHYTLVGLREEVEREENVGVISASPVLWNKLV